MSRVKKAIFAVPEIEAQVYDVAEAAAKSKSTEAAIRAALRDGRLKGFRWGRKWKIPREQFDKLLRGEDT
jgi:excisionase family DNA binding protein